ncbi:MAG: hypothetical protein JXD23_12485 [Spirochaetales bacterium]|nr:hypothetical protein [Spirochaetales bacterium]
MKRKIGAMFAFLALTRALFADLPPSVSGLFTPEAAALLAGKGEATAVFKENGKLHYLPSLPQARRVADKIDAMNPMFGVEVCLAHRLAGRQADTPEGLVKIYNTLASVSSLKGTQYYSVTRDRMREFFTESYRIDDPEKRNKLPDLRFTSPPPSAHRIFTFQDDSTFGRNVYRIDYWFTGGCIVMNMENASKVWYGILPLVDPGNLAYLILVYPTGEYLVFYSVVCVKGANPFGILESRTESFHNRIKALDEWFRVQSGLF